MVRRRVHNSRSCTYWRSAHPDHMEPPGTAVTGVCVYDPVTSTSDFVDLYDKSCLNGWTMGNIAATATDVTRFYFALANGMLVSNASLASMLNFTNFTGGTLPGGQANTPYGLGLFSLMLRFPLAGVQSCVSNHGKQLPHCECSPAGRGGKASGGGGDGDGNVPASEEGSIRSAPAPSSAASTATTTTTPTTCFFSTPGWGHGGLDWGSGFPVSGWMPDLSLSFALGSNTGEGFPPGANTTFKNSKNNAAYSVALCRVVQATVQSVYPGYPLFATGPVPEEWNWPTDHWC